METNPTADAGVATVHPDETSTEELENVINEKSEEASTSEGDPESDTEVEETDDQQDQEEEEPEHYEFDFGGNKTKFAKGDMSPELAEKVQSFGTDLWTDYTKKSQAIAESNKALAETTKSLEAREGVVQKMSSMQGEILDEYSRGLQVRSEIDRLAAMDTSSLWKTDPDKANHISDALSGLKVEFQNSVNKVDQLERDVGATGAAEVTRRMEEGRKIVNQKIKGFDAKAGEVIDYVVKTYGIPKKEAETWPLNPAGASMAYKAMLFDKLQSNLKSKTKKKTAEVTPVVPISSKGGKPRKDPEKMSTAEWMRWRNKNKQVR